MSDNRLFPPHFGKASYEPGRRENFGGQNPLISLVTFVIFSDWKEDERKSSRIM